MKKKRIWLVGITVACLAVTAIVYNFATVATGENSNRNMCWSWWYYPQAVSSEGDSPKLFFGYTKNNGYAGVCEYNIDDSSFMQTDLKKSNVDDHSSCAVSLMNDGRIMAVYSGGHNEDNYIHVRISQKPGDASAFKPEVLIQSSGRTSYSQVFHINHRYYVFYRRDNKDWCWSSSIDGQTWDGEHLLVTAPVQYYCLVRETTQDQLLRVLMYSNPDTSENDIRMCFLDLLSGEILNADHQTMIGNLSTGIEYDAADVVIPTVEGKVQRLFDAAITDPLQPVIAYAAFDLKAENTSVYMIYDTHGKQLVCDGGRDLWAPKYQGGMSFLSPDKVVVSRNDFSDDHIEIYAQSSEGWKQSENIYQEAMGTTPIRNVRPICDIHGKAIVWQRGYYNDTNYNDFSMDAIVHLLSK